MTYSEWNHALDAYFAADKPRGSSIFLAVDPTVIAVIGAMRGIEAEGAQQAFCDAVRAKVYTGGPEEICVGHLRGRDGDGPPRGLGFISLMVLAASQMGDGEVDEGNYFVHLRELLRLGTDVRRNRPDGMSPGYNAEEPLWREWQRHLEERGYLATARRGPDGAYRYLNYPLSQALLRVTDREKLSELFRSSPWYRDYREPDLLMARLISYRDRLTKHLRELLSSRGERYVAVAAAIHELHQEHLGQGQDQPTGQTRELVAGLIRYPGGLGELPVYSLLPRLRPQDVPVLQNSGVQVEVDGAVELLRPDPEAIGFALPVGNVDTAAITRGAAYRVRNSTLYDAVRLPERPFHVLVADPDDPQGGVYRSGSAPAPDTHFVFLGSDLVVKEMERLREAGQVDWSAKRPIGGTTWFELSDCMVLYQNWSDMRIGNTDLFNALRPRRATTLGLSGGLRDPGSHAYLTGHGPVLTVYGTLPQVRVKVVRLVGEGERQVWEGIARHRVPVEWGAMPFSVAGTYRIDVGDVGEPDQRVVSVVDWDVLRIGPRPTGDTGRWEGLLVPSASTEPAEGS